LQPLNSVQALPFSCSHSILFKPCPSLAATQLCWSPALLLQPLNSVQALPFSCSHSNLFKPCSSPVCCSGGVRCRIYFLYPLRALTGIVKNCNGFPVILLQPLLCPCFSCCHNYLLNCWRSDGMGRGNAIIKSFEIIILFLVLLIYLSIYLLTCLLTYLLLTCLLTYLITYFTYLLNLLYLL